MCLRDFSVNIDLTELSAHDRSHPKAEASYKKRKSPHNIAHDWWKI